MSRRLDALEQRIKTLEDKLQEFFVLNANLKAQLAEARAPREKIVSVRDESGGSWKQAQ